MKFNSFQGLEQETAVTESRGVEQPTQGGQRATPEPCQPRQPEQHTLPVPHTSLISADQRCHTRAALQRSEGHNWVSV